MDETVGHRSSRYLPEPVKRPSLFANNAWSNPNVANRHISQGVAYGKGEAPLEEVLTLGELMQQGISLAALFSIWQYLVYKIMLLQAPF